MDITKRLLSKELNFKHQIYTLYILPVNIFSFAAQFIQPPMKPPTETVQFTIPQAAMPHLYSLAFYLGQNLRQFLHTPKYSSSRSEDHFQDRTVAGTVEGEKGVELPDNEVYVYNRYQRAGRTGIYIYSDFDQQTQTFYSFQQGILICQILTLLIGE